MNFRFYDLFKSGTSILIVTLILFSCDDKIDLLSDKPDTTVVFGLLEPGKNVQTFRVNKSFIGEQNAAVMAEDPDNFNFNPGEITLTLQGYQNGKKVGSELTAIRNDKDYVKSNTGLDGEPGFFSSEDHVVYEFYTDSTDTEIDIDSRYELTLTNNTTGEVLTSEIEIVDEFTSGRITTPRGKSLSFAQGTNAYNDFRLEFSSVIDGRRYEVYLLVPYRTTQITGVGDTSSLDTLSILMGNAATSNIATSSQSLTISFDGELFFRALNLEFSKDKSVKYLLDPFTLKVVSGGEDLHTYILVNQPSDGIVQEKPEYTNINGGIGIFSSRSTTYIDDYYMNNTTAPSVRSGEYTLGSGIVVCDKERNTSAGSYTCP